MFGSSPFHTLVPWANDVKNFPPIVQYFGGYWEFVTYDHAVREAYSYKLYFAELDISTMTLAAQNKAVDVFDLIDDSKNTNCECGAIYTSFKNHHMFFCPLWKAGI